MAEWRIDRVDKAKPDDLRFLIGKLQEYNDAHSPTPFNRSELRMFLRDGQGNIGGGLIGSVSMHCLIIQVLWLDESLRGLGHGASLVAEAEALAKASGATQCLVETTDFQAPGFYERLGYAAIFEVPDAPRGSKTLFMHKRLG